MADEHNHEESTPQERAESPEEIARKQAQSREGSIAYKIERIEAVDNRVDVHVLWAIPWGESAFKNVPDSIQVYQNAAGRVTEQDIRRALNERLIQFIIPTHLREKIAVEESVGSLVGEWGVINPS